MDPMTSLDENKAIILEYEEKFANSVSFAVIDRPKLSTWMILMPIIFIYYFYQLKKYADGRKAFSQHFMLTRKRSLEAAATSLEVGGKPDVESIVNMSNAPTPTHSDYREWLKVLLEHYRYLLRSKGDGIGGLIRSAYETKTNYLLFINQLSRVEKQFNAALKPFLEETTQDVDQIVESIERRCETLRREDAQSFFP